MTNLRETQSSLNGTGNVRSAKRASIEKSLFPRASNARQQVRAAAIQLVGVVALLMAVVLMFTSVPVTVTCGIAVAGVALCVASSRLADLVNMFDGRFNRCFGAPRALDLEEPGSRQVARAKLYLKEAREKSVRHAARLGATRTWALAMAVLGATLFGFKYYESHKVVTEGVYQMPPTLAYLGPVLNDPGTRPTVLANLPVKVLPVGRKAGNAVTHFVNHAPGHLETMRGAGVSGNKEGLTKAADNLDRDIQAADEALREVETSAVAPEIRTSATESRKKLSSFRTIVQKARQDPNQIIQAQDELSRVIEFLRNLLDTLARFLDELMQFLHRMNSSGMTGNGVSISTATQGGSMMAMGVKGQNPTQDEWNRLCASYRRDFENMPPTFIPPPATPIPGTPPPSDPVIDLTVPPVLSPSIPPTREADRRKDKTPEKPEQKTPNPGGPVPPNN